MEFGSLGWWISGLVGLGILMEGRFYVEIVLEFLIWGILRY